MKTIRQTAREEIRRNAVPLLKYCFIMATVCSGVSLVLQPLNQPLIPLALTLVLNVVFLFGMNLLYLKALNHEAYSVRDFLEFGRVWKKALGLFGLVSVLLLVAPFLFQALSRIPIAALALPGVIVLGVFGLNAINHLTLFGLIRQELSVIQALKKGVRLFLSARSLILPLLMKTIGLVLIGSFLVYAVNVFVYAPQIDAALKSAEVVSEALIDPYFSTDLSYLIQSIGMQLVAGFISIVTGMTYGTVYCQQA